jgi:hypothetical protein
MVRALALLSTLLGLLLLLRLAGVVGGHQPDPGPVYTVAALRQRLAAQPAAWVGRTVLVRAIAEPCPWWGAAEHLRRCAARPLVLVAAATEQVAAPLPLVRPAPPPLLTRVRSLPLLGALLPQPPELPLFTLARFRVRLLAPPAGAGTDCYAALLLDAVPLASQEG